MKPLVCALGHPGAPAQCLRLRPSGGYECGGGAPPTAPARASANAHAEANLDPLADVCPPAPTCTPRPTPLAHPDANKRVRGDVN